MDIQAHFTDIGPVIKADLDAARQSIDAAVAWLTDPALFEALLRAARRGCRVRLALLDDTTPVSGSVKIRIGLAQIEPALEVFSPKPEDVMRARKLRDAILEAEAKGLGAAQIDGQMVDVASLRILRNTIDRAELFGM